MACGSVCRVSRREDPLRSLPLLTVRRLTRGLARRLMQWRMLRQRNWNLCAVGLSTAVLSVVPARLLTSNHISGNGIY